MTACYSSMNTMSSNCATFAAGTSACARFLLDTAIIAVSIFVIRLRSLLLVRK